MGTLGVGSTGSGVGVRSGTRVARGALGRVAGCVGIDRGGSGTEMAGGASTGRVSVGGVSSMTGITSVSALAGSCGSVETVAVDTSIGITWQSSRVTFPRRPRPRTLPLTLSSLPTAACLSRCTVGPSSQITLSLSEFLKITFEILISATTSRRKISVPLRETRDPLSNVAVNELAEYEGSCALAVKPNPMSEHSTAAGILVRFPRCR